MLSDYTVIYKTGDGTRREFYLLARSISNAVLSATELLPRSCEIIRTYHDPSWK